MGTNELRKRDNWQTSSGGKAEKAEKRFFNVFSRAFEGTDFEIIQKPKHFTKIYLDVPLSEETRKSIYTPDKPIVKHGISPDCAIHNKATGKTLYIEIKRQDGWVEGKLPKDGRGNAHERGCKLFTPGLLKLLREQGKISEEILPFWIVYQGDIARDPKRVREIHCWFDKYKSNFFLWSNTASDESVVQHFNSQLKKFLL